MKPPPIPNPQGKGLSPVLDSLQQAQQQACVTAKDIQTIEHELFTSLFILNSQIKFKPAVGQNYWLYFKSDNFRLSLIPPDQWQSDRSGEFVAQCTLHGDLIWSLQLADQCQNNDTIMALIHEKKQRFDQHLQQAEKIADILPFYVADLPFISRILATSAGCSLLQSMHKSGISGLNYHQAQKLIGVNRRSHGE